MTADPSVYHSERLARSYALYRPAVHASIWTRIAATIPPGHEVLSALDIGCGAGASTRALSAHARDVSGIDPSREMLGHARLALPNAAFTLGRAESLPFESESFDLVAAAGSLNYSEPLAALREASRVLSSGGRYVAYDFSTGRVGGDETLLAACFERFRTEFPPLPGYALDLKALPFGACALALTAFETFDVPTAMAVDTYIEYILGETNVEAAIAGGMTEAQARRVCDAIFTPLFRGELRTVQFPAVFAVARKVAVAR